MNSKIQKLVIPNNSTLHINREQVLAAGATIEARASAVAQPDWSTAPDWAEYWSVNREGRTRWSADRPRFCSENLWKIFTDRTEFDSIRLSGEFTPGPHSVVRRPEKHNLVPLPSWSEAPDWAEYRMVGQGERIAWWFNEQPTFDDEGYIVKNPSQWEVIPKPRSLARWDAIGGKASFAKRPYSYRPYVLPSWDEAPDWAEYRSVNALGAVAWTRQRPQFRTDNWWETDTFTDKWASAGPSVGVYHPDFVCGPASIERRPPRLPSWDEAPDWAEYRAVNAKGLARWFEVEPQLDADGLFSMRPGYKWQNVSPVFAFRHIPWETSIERRPPRLPSWDEAPDWAEYRCVAGKLGVVYWFREEPKFFGPDVSGPRLDTTGCVHGTDYQRAEGRANADFVKGPDSIERRPFEPPWDKIANPYDRWVRGRFAATADFFTATRDAVAVPDIWTDPDDIARAEPDQVYRRPGT